MLFRSRGRDADEDQQRRHQEAAADAEHAGHETNRRAHRQDEENIDRNIGDGKIKLHARCFGVSPEAGRNRSWRGFPGNADQMPGPCIAEIDHGRGLKNPLVPAFLPLRALQIRMW